MRTYITCVGLVVLGLLLLAIVLPDYEIRIVRQSAAASTLWPGYYDDGKGLVLVKTFETDDALTAIQEWRDAHHDRFERLMTMSVIRGGTGLCHILIAYYPVATDSVAAAKMEE